MTKKILCFFTALSIILSAFMHSEGALSAYAADNDASEQFSEDALITIVSSQQEDESAHPVGGVSEDIAEKVEWNESWDAEVDKELFQKRGSDRKVETKDPDGAYSGLNDGSGTYGYEHLTAAQKKMYTSMKTAINTFVASDGYKQDLDKNSASVKTYTKPDGDTAFTEDDMYKARTALLYDNPQYFFFKNWYQYGDREDGSLMVSFEVDDYYYTYSTRLEAQEAIDEVSEGWLEELNAIMAEASETDEQNGDYLAAVYAHNLIIDAVNYAYVPNTDTPQPARWAHSIAGVFTGQGVVCEGYAKAYQYLLNKCGIDNVYIVGQSTGRDSGGHAWNCIYLDNNWYPVDVTWDDLGDDAEETNEIWYSYFAIPGNEFNKDHVANNMNNPGMYEIPVFSSSDDHSYYKYFGGYGNGVIKDEATAQSVYDAAAAKKPDFTNYLYFSVEDSTEIKLLRNVLKLQSISSWRSPYFSKVFRFEYIDDISNPATEITLDPEKLTVEVGATGEIAAVISAESNDRISFSLDSNKYCSITPNAKEKKVTVTGKKNGKAVLTARTVAGKAVATCEITIGTGVPDPEDINVWQNGGKDYKKIQITTTLTATKWEDSKQKIKAGKLVWIASDEDITIEFDREKHKVLTKTKPTRGSVNNKGVVTAKTAGKLYVYCCDTGSFAVEKTVVEVLASPSKLFLGASAGVSESKDALKKFALNVGQTGRVYICPFVKDGTADETNQYTATLAKADQSEYVSLSKVKSDGKGGFYFDVTGLDFDRSKSKAVSVKITVECVQSGKKASVTAVICNPVQSAEASEVTGKTTLANKKDSVSMTLALATCIKDVTATSDKLKVYIGSSSVALDQDGKKVVADKGATVKAKFNAKNMSLTLTAGQDAGQTALVYLAATNPATKKTKLFKILQVKADGALEMSQ